MYIAPVKLPLHKELLKAKRYNWLVDKNHTNQFVESVFSVKIEKDNMNQQERKNQSVLLLILKRKKVNLALPKIPNRKNNSYKKINKHLKLNADL